MSLLSEQKTSYGDIFNQESGGGDLKQQNKSPTPFAIRFSEEERSYLKELAGNKPLGTFIRDIVLSDKAQKRRQTRKPALEDKQFAELLAALGQSRLSSNLNQLARHANVGTLDVSEDVAQQLEDACAAVLAMRDALLMALGLKIGQ